MRGGEFRRLAEESLRHYGDAPYFFLRELAQNSRDADSRNIWVAASRDGEEEVLTFEDDGRGMSFEVARSYLYRLYASSKEGDKGAAGRFGVGFWSVLRFSPVLVRVESRSEEGAWGVELDSGFESSEVEPLLSHRGTCVILRRRAQFGDEGAYVEDVLAGLRRTCGHLRTRRGHGRVLPVWFNGEQVSGPLTLGLEHQMRFRQGRIDGVVGLGETPGVELLVRGLPVWQGNVLEELSSRGGGGGATALEVGEGLAPVIKVNADDLTVVMSRSAVVDDAALARVRRVTERALERLVDGYVDRSLGRGAVSRLMRRWWRWVGRHCIATGVLLGVLLLVVVVVADGRLPRILGDQFTSAVRMVGDVNHELGAEDGVSLAAGAVHQEEPVRWPGPAAAEDRLDYSRLQRQLSYTGSNSDGGARAVAPALRWTPPLDLYLRILATDDYDPKRGFVADLVDGWGGVEHDGVSAECENGGCVRFDLDIADARGEVVLPVPTGYDLVSGGVLVDGQRMPVRSGRHWALVVGVGSGVKRLSYYVTKSDGPNAEAEGKGGSSILEEELWPADLRAKADELCLGGPGAIEEYLAGALSYAAESSWVVRPEDAGWLEAVWRTRRGDCDVLNGVAILLLSRCGYAARLAMGFVGVDGRSVPGLHAWAEYRVQSVGSGYGAGWQVMDLTRRTGGGPEAIRNESPGFGVGGVASGGGGVVDSSGLEPALAPAGVGESEENYESGPVDPVEGASAAPSGSPGNAASGRPAIAKEGVTGESQAGPEEEEEAASLPAPAWGETSESVDSGAWGVWPLGLAGLLLVMVVLLALVRRNRFSSASGADVGRGRAEEIVAKLAVRALLQPGLWSSRSGIMSQPVVPLHSGKRLSLANAIWLAQRGRLASGARGSGIVGDVVAGRGRILVAGTGPFAEVVRRIPGVTDLDRLESLKQVADLGVEEEARAAAAWLNGCWGCKRGGPGRSSIKVLLYSSPAQPDVVQDFHLGMLRFKEGAPWVARVVVVNLEGWSSAARVIGVTGQVGAIRFSPELAFFLAQHITLNSVMLAREAARLRRMAARGLLEVGWGSGKAN